MKRLWILVFVIAAVGIVGASMSSNEDTPSASLHVELVNNSEDLDGTVIEYADLTPEQQAFFEQAVSDDDFGTAMPDGVDHSVWYDTTAVRYQNRTYRVFVSEP